MYTRCQQQPVCLHGSILYFAVHQKWVIRNPNNEKAAGKAGGLSKMFGK
jgi:hypothetical protein